MSDSKRSDGGPAYPSRDMMQKHAGGYGGYTMGGHDGMSLHDHLVGQALAGIVGTKLIAYYLNHGTTAALTDERIAEDVAAAFRYADAVLAERERRRAL